MSAGPTQRRASGRGAPVFGVALALFAGPALADTLPVAADSQINLTSLAAKGGVLTTLTVKNAPPGASFQAFGRFDLTALPPDALVSKATLRLFPSVVIKDGVVDVAPVLAAWDEATLTGGTAPALGAPVASFPVVLADKKRWLSVDVTSLVQQWVDGSLENHGLALMGSLADDVNVKLDSKESPSTSHPMEIEVALASYSLSAPAGGPGDVVNVDADGGVGIGLAAASPETALHIRADFDNFGVLVDSLGASGSEIGLHSGPAGYASLVKNAYYAPGWTRFNESQGAFLQEVAPSGAVSFLVAGSGGGFVPWNTALTLWPQGYVSFGSGIPIGHVTMTSTGAPLALDRLSSDGILAAFLRDTNLVGTISVAAGVVSYNAFSGSHYAWSEEALEPGLLVSMTGDNRSLEDRSAAEPVYGVRPTAGANERAVLGVAVGRLEPGKADQPQTENPHLVVAVGNAEVWVVDTGRDIEPGDALVSSAVPGHAMRDDGSFAVAHVVGRAAGAVRWAEVAESPHGLRRRRVSVLLEPHDREGTAALRAALAAREAELEALGRTVSDQSVRIERLQAALAEGADLAARLAALEARLAGDRPREAAARAAAGGAGGR